MPTDTDIQTTLATPLAKLADHIGVLVEQYPDTSLAEVEQQAEALRRLAMQAAERSVYFDQIALGVRHETAVKAVNRMQAGLARLFGFAYPDSHIVKF